MHLANFLCNIEFIISYYLILYLAHCQFHIALITMKFLYCIFNEVFFSMHLSQPNHLNAFVALHVSYCIFIFGLPNQPKSTCINPYKLVSFRNIDCISKGIQHTHTIKIYVEVPRLRKNRYYCQKAR